MYLEIYVNHYRLKMKLTLVFLTSKILNVNLKHLIIVMKLNLKRNVVKLLLCLVSGLMINAHINQIQILTNVQLLKTSVIKWLVKLLIE